MISRERVLRAFNREDTDRLPIDVGGLSNLSTLHKDAYDKLKEYLGLNETTVISSLNHQSVFVGEKVREYYKSDCYPLYFPQDEKKLGITLTESGDKEYIDAWGVTWRFPKDGYYFDMVASPYEDEKKLKEIVNFIPPKIDEEIIRSAGEKFIEIHDNTDYFTIFTPPLSGGVYVPAQWLMGYIPFLINLVSEGEMIKNIIEKVADYHIETIGRLIKYSKNSIDAYLISDDLALQDGPIFSPQIYRELIKPAQKRVVDFIKENTNSKIIYHCCGDAYEFIQDFIDIGFDALNPIQVSTKGFKDTAKLNEDYGNEIVFWGGTCNSQSTFVNGSPDDVREEVRQRIKDLAPGMGLVLSSIHNVQRDVPVENIDALFKAFYDYGTAYCMGKL